MYVPHTAVEYCLPSARILTLTVEQKCDIATRELDELREDRQRKRDEAERAFDNHRVSLKQLRDTV